MKLGKHIIEKGVELAKVQANEALKTFDDVALLDWVNSELDRVTEPLEEEINKTKSYWVKLRNRVYINVIRQSASAIVTNLKREISKL